MKSEVFFQGTPLTAKKLFAHLAYPLFTPALPLGRAEVVFSIL